MERAQTQLSQRENAMPIRGSCRLTSCTVRPDDLSSRSDGTVLRAALGAFVARLRAERKLTAEALAARADIELTSLLAIERCSAEELEPRTVYMLAEAVKVPTECLMQLSGHLALCDPQVLHAAKNFLASSTSGAARWSLGEFVRRLQTTRSEMGKKNVHVVPAGNGWAVKQEGRVGPLSNHRTQGAAEAAGRKVAQAREGELVIHRPNGQIRDKDSYGRDPNPPRDTKH